MFGRTLSRGALSAMIYMNSALHHATPTFLSAGRPPLLAAVFSLSCIASAACTDTGVPPTADGTDGCPTAGVDAGTSSPAECGETVMEVGGADDKGKQFVPLVTEVKAPILRGPQGGQHIWVMVRFRGDGLSSKKLRIATTMSIRDTKVVVKPGTVTMTQTLTEEDGWFRLKTAIPSFVKCPCQVYGKTLDIDVDVVDLYGRTAKAQGQIVGTWDGVCSGSVPGSCASQ